LAIALVSLMPMPGPYLTAGQSQDKAKGPTVSHTYEDAEGYEILSLVLDGEAQHWKLDKLEVYGKTRASNATLSVCNQLPAEFRAAADDFGNRSKTELRFRRRFSTAHQYRLTPFAGVQYFEISAVGFDDGRVHAIASVTKGCGSMCIWGRTYLFRKNDKGWQKISEICEVTS
jgi:hypothetical protein